MFQFKKHLLCLSRAGCRCHRIGPRGAPRTEDGIASGGGHERGPQEPSAWSSLASLNCHFSAQPPGHLGMLTTRDLLADAVDLCAELGRVLETVHLSSLLVAPAVLETATVQGGEGSGDREAACDHACLWMVPGSGLFVILSTHTRFE